MATMYQGEEQQRVDEKGGLVENFMKTYLQIESNFFFLFDS